MKRVVLIACIATNLMIASAAAQFSGKFELGPPGCEDKGLCTLTYDLRFKDPKGVEWLAAAKDQTDGASIPTWAQSFIGKPFEKLFIKAAVIHDHYCERHVRPWRATHRVFYDGLIDQGVDAAKAKLMYYAVYLGGPKWVDLIPGKSCGKNCLFQFETGVAGQSNAVKASIMTRPATYGQPGFVAELQNVEKLINENGSKIDLDFLEKRAENLRPTDFYYQHGDKVAIGGGIAFE